MHKQFYVVSILLSKAPGFFKTGKRTASHQPQKSNAVAFLFRQLGVRVSEIQADRAAKQDALAALQAVQPKKRAVARAQSSSIGLRLCQAYFGFSMALALVFGFFCGPYMFEYDISMVRVQNSMVYSIAATLIVWCVYPLMDKALRRAATSTRTATMNRSRSPAKS